MQPLQQLQQLWTSLMLIPASPEAVASLTDLDPLLAWGVLTRGLGVVYAIAFSSIAVQIRGLAGRDGMSPFAPMMQQMAHDFPGWRRLLYFPPLLWLTGGGDAALVGLPVAGVGFGGGVMWMWVWLGVLCVRQACCCLCQAWYCVWQGW